MIEVRSRAPSVTQALARALAPLVRAGDVIALAGDLGAGKTCFVKGLAEGLGLDGRQVASPTFNIVLEHRGGRLPLHHVDLYRIASGDELDELGLEHYLAGDGVCAVEWLERFPRLAPAERLEVRLALVADEERALTVEGFGARGETLERAWAPACLAIEANATNTRGSE